MESFVYKWTNTQSGEYYIGVHKGTPDDGYVGSGKKFTSKYRKHKEHFVREILETFSDYEDALQYEQRIVNNDTIEDPLCLNLKPGGQGGGTKWSEEHKTRMKNIMIEKWKNPLFRDQVTTSAKNVWDDQYKERRRKAGISGFSNVDYVERAKTRKNNGDYGKHRRGYIFSKGSKEMMSIKAKQREKVECPHCSRIGAKPQMSRWHFDNCKEKITCS